ncbi:DUF1311 domain-containing protein [Synergistaceae bacterium OttesenSCG-928-I11]|nr:DUF1311 domain-containing protein [Synergistaceae bacterium OttesenSCG-928-I11]
MKKITIFAFAVILCFYLFPGAERSASASDEKHPIDAEVERRIEADYTTSSMLEAIQYGYEEWDKLLNKNYKALMQKMSKEQQEKLRASQREWIKFRDLEFDFNKDFFSDMGSLGRVTGLSLISDFVKERALFLGRYLSELEPL